MHEAKSKLSSLVDQAINGNDIIIAKAGEPLVKLVPVVIDNRRRIPGMYKGQIKIAKDFDETPRDIIDAFHGVDS